MTKYGHATASFRERVARLIPRALTEYPFEVLAAFIGLIFGLPLLFGLASPTSLIVLLPALGYWAYSVALVLGGATVAVGLRSFNPLVLASGLQLLGGSFCVYALAVVAFGGWAVSWLAFGAYADMGLISLARALHFRRLLDIQKGATMIREKDAS